jgi:Flp pilus assembly protein TadD
LKAPAKTNDDMASIARGPEATAEDDFLGALYKGGELLAAGKIIEAREHLEKAHGLEPKNEKAQNLLGLTYFKLGLFDDAARVYELLVRENPVDPTLRVNLGLVYLKTNALERCIKEFETATDLDPGHQKAHNYLGLALAQAGEYAKAREHFHAAGSEAMAEKMTKALMARAEAEEVSMTVKSPPPATAHAVTGKPAEAVSAPPPAEPPPLPEPPAPPVADHEESTWDVMSDEEVPSDAYVTAEDAVVPVAPALPPAPSGPRLDSDWGAHFASNAEPPPPAAQDDDMRFAEDEGPSAATLAVPAEADAMPVLDATAVQMDVTTLDTSVAEAIDAEATVLTTSAPEPAPPRAPAWLTMEAAEAANAPAETQ